MSFLADLSLRWKIPLRVVVAVLGTAFAVTAALVTREYDELRGNLDAHAKSLARVLANTLVTPLMHDDTWRAYEILRSTREATPVARELQAEVILVTDAEYRVFASSKPREFPLGMSPATLGGAYSMLRVSGQKERAGELRVVEPDNAPLYFVMAPLEADGVSLGHVILGYSKISFVPRFLDLVGRAVLVTLLVLALIMPISWVWARSTGQPLLRLAEAMRRVPGELDTAHMADLPLSGDEIGQLGQAFRRMVGELKDKQELERQMLVSERLAAVGRLSAGIAHEINNPLGGMLTAINTYQRHGQGDPLALKTLSLLERGLTQIRNTVAALLVETSTRDRSFAPEDVDDIIILLEGDAHAHAVRIATDVTLPGPLPLPATLLRQILLNLLLNGITAASGGGLVRLEISAAADKLSLAVHNDGRHISEGQMAYLFEPFASGSERGHGLGLWIVYQIVHQLGGGLSVESAPGDTTFNVEIPYGQSAPDTAAAVSH